MFGFSLTWLIWLLVGVFIGLLLGNPKFRRGFFVGFRKFLVQISQGARSYSEQQRPRGHRQSGSYSSYGRQNEPRQYHDERKGRLVTCPECNGSGRVKVKIPKMLDEKLWDNTEECPTCEGTGKIYERG